MAEQEERLAAELERMQLEKLREEKMRQQIRQTAPELRELERKLNAGYINMELATQRMHNEAMTATARQEELMAAREMEAMTRRAEEQGEQGGAVVCVCVGTCNPVSA